MAEYKYIYNYKYKFTYKYNTHTNTNTKQSILVMSSLGATLRGLIILQLLHS